MSNKLNVVCSRRKCDESRISAATGRNGKAYCLEHLPKRQTHWAKTPIALLGVGDRVRAERNKAVPPSALQLAVLTGPLDVDTLPH